MNKKGNNIRLELTDDADSGRLSELQRRIGYIFKRPELLRQALRHRSLPAPNNERLEFLGDALLGAITAEQLYQLLPQVKEGELSRCRTALVSGESLAKLAERFGVEHQLQFVPTDLRRVDLITRHRSLLADAVEAIIGAIYLDSDWDNTRGVVVTWLQDRLVGAACLDVKDAKTKLQEWLQEYHLHLPEYQLIHTSGLEHDKVFEVECRVQTKTGDNVTFRGSGGNKRSAEQMAARIALEALMELDEQGK